MRSGKGRNRLFTNGFLSFHGAFWHTNVTSMGSPRNIRRNYSDSGPFRAGLL